MRKIVLMMSMSLDGYIEGPDRDISWHRVDDELHQHFNDTAREMGGFLDGRVTHELMAGFWPTADQDPEAPAPVAEFAAIWREKPKIVYSRTLQHADWNTTIVREVVPRRSGPSRSSRAATWVSAVPTSPPPSCGTASSTSSGCTSIPSSSAPAPPSSRRAPLPSTSASSRAAPSATGWRTCDTRWSPDAEQRCTGPELMSQKSLLLPGPAR
ncbi:hypothetical protein SAURM35S_00876 [Streptomyces aurantiogriseus]